MHSLTRTAADGIPGDLLPHQECSFCSSLSPTFSVPIYNPPVGKDSFSSFHFDAIFSSVSSFLFLQQSISASLPPVHCTFTRAACAVLCQWNSLIPRLSVTPLSSSSPLSTSVAHRKSTDCSVSHQHKHTHNRGNNSLATSTKYLGQT